MKKYMAIAAVALAAGIGATGCQTDDEEIYEPSGADSMEYSTNMNNGATGSGQWDGSADQSTPAGAGGDVGGVGNTP